MNAPQKEELRQKLLLTLDLFAAGCEMMKKKLKRKYPHLSDEEITKLHDQWLISCPEPEIRDAGGARHSRHFSLEDHE